MVINNYFKNLILGTLIYTDSWKGYGDLKDLGYKHKESHFSLISTFNPVLYISIRTFF